MWFNVFFEPTDELVKDSCPVCKFFFEETYLRTERIYYCYDCEKVVEFHPYETVPKMVVKKKTSNLDQDYTPYEEDMCWKPLPKPFTEEEEPPLA